MTVDITHTRKEIRECYNLACHGAGADVRRVARRDLEAMATRMGLPLLRDFFEAYDLDIHAYFASRPI